MDIFDVVILVAAVAYAIGGYRSGAVVGVLSMIGFFGGAALGAQLAKPIGSHISGGRAQVPVAIFLVLVLAMLGQLLGVWVAGHVRARVVPQRAKVLDSAAGAIVGVAGVLLVAWMIAVPLASSPYPSLAAEATNSKIVRGVDNVLPQGARNLYASLRNYLDQSGFPPVFGDLPSTSVQAVAPPPADLPAAFRAEVVAARSSVLKIYGQAPQCSRGIEGSGFVYAPEHMLTNAHVVAGTNQVQVQVPSGKALTAHVVLYDPNADVAVLDVPGLKSAPLTFTGDDAKRGDIAAVLGYPENGPYTIRTARVRGMTEISGTNIYGNGDVNRSIYSIRAIVRQGNSGGPLLAQNGTVLGMVFATARDSSDTGFVLSDAEISDAGAAAAANATAPVGTGACTPD